MEYTLSSIFTNIDAYIVAVRMETFINFLLHISQHHIHCLALVISEIKIVGNMPFGNYQGMTWRNRITIVECNARICLTYYFNPPL